VKVGGQLFAGKEDAGSFGAVEFVRRESNGCDAGVEGEGALAKEGNAVDDEGCICAACEMGNCFEVDHGACFTVDS